MLGASRRGMPTALFCPQRILLSSGGTQPPAGFVLCQDIAPGRVEIR